MTLPPCLTGGACFAVGRTVNVARGILMDGDGLDRFLWLLCIASTGRVFITI
jgi:hypothetical protein